MREPPRWARQWLTWTLPRDERGAAVAGDLFEEYVRRAEGIGQTDGNEVQSARRWYAREALSVGARYAFERTRRFALRRGARYRKIGRAHV